MKGGQRIIPDYVAPNDPFTPKEQKQTNYEKRQLENKVTKTKGPATYDTAKQFAEVEMMTNLQNRKMVDLQVYSPEQKKSTAPMKKKVEDAFYVPVRNAYNYVGYPVTQNPFGPMNVVYGNGTNVTATLGVNPCAGNPNVTNVCDPFYQMNPVQLVKNVKIDVSGPHVEHALVSHIYEDTLPEHIKHGSYESITKRMDAHNFIRSIFLDRLDGEMMQIVGCKTGSKQLLSVLKFLGIQSNTPNNPYKDLASNIIVYKACYPIILDKCAGQVLCAKDALGLNVRIYNACGPDSLQFKLGDSGCLESNMWREIYYYQYVRDNILKQKVSPNFINMYLYLKDNNSTINFNQIEVARGNPFVNGQTTNALIALTEAPTNNITNWSTSSYQYDGNIKRMATTGYHTKDEWNAVLFQILVALYVLQKHKISIKSFSLEDNVYVKEIPGTQSQNTRYWNYTVDGVQYFVPNLGFVVLIDTKYKGDGKKIESPNIFPKCSEMVDDQTVLNDAINVFSSIKPETLHLPDDTIKMTRNINERLAEIKKTGPYSLGQVIMVAGAGYMNNRIGTLLKGPEIPNIRKDSSEQFQPGQLLVYEFRNETYKFVTYLGPGRTGTAKVYTRNYDGAGGVQCEGCNEEVPLSQLYNYSRSEPVKQDFEPGRNISDVIETYNV